MQVFALTSHVELGLINLAHAQPTVNSFIGNIVRA